MGQIPERGPVRSQARILRLEEADSTNAVARRLASEGERGPLWIQAQRQTAGRGRSSRAWLSPAGNLAATLLISPACPAALLPQLSLLAGVAAHDAVRLALSGTLRPAAGGAGSVRLKWPNDLLIDAAKVGGILVESTVFGSDAVAVIGIGINVAAAPHVGDRAVTALRAHGAACTPEELLDRLAAAMERWLDVWALGAGFPAIRSAWLERALPQGTAVTVNAGGAPVGGTFAGLDTDGALLLVDAAGQRRRFSFGDVSLGPAEA